MSRQNQCEMCRKRCYSCGFYDDSNDDYCNHFEKPVDNSKMFSHIFSSEGRINRLEYFLSLVMAWGLAGILLWVAIFLLHDNGIELESGLQIRLFLAVTLGPSLGLIWLAGKKRAHDSGAPEWLALAPVSLILWPHLFTLVFAILGTLYLLKDASEEGVNEYGTNPNIPYDTQIEMQYSDQ
ncbi:MAG: DUF805 domain-containing protein [Muribaculaceae bacterium]|nr:DUF805 domain-containing protein [Muribaculaceae bacterium]